MRGEVIEIVGRLSSGRTSLLTAWLTDVTRRGGFVALVDADGAFDPSSAVRAGVDLRRLLWVRTGSRRDTALRAVDLLVRCRGLALVAVDLGESPPRLSLAAAFRWRMAVQRAGTTLVILTARRIAGAGAAPAVRTARRALEWSGGPRPTRLARVATDVEVLRGQAPAAAHWWCAGGAWPVCVGRGSRRPPSVGASPRWASVRPASVRAARRARR